MTPAFRIEAVPHDDLGPDELVALGSLFDDEYLDAFGPWHPAQPYGYAGHDVHVLAWEGSRLVGHVGWARRRVDVGGTEVAIAGVGGVLVADRARGRGLGRRLLGDCAVSMKGAGDIDFGFLGCRESVVPFYRACGWHRISAPERSVARDGSTVVVEPGPPLLILPLRTPADAWPPGTADLRGRAW
ncbi:GNAT family N-acetyltransferase [Microbacterium sp. CSI-V]|nr:GNAT family N-acetyltransferase [Microbacterium sp. TL13]ONI66158.1 GNAT family N-acetyltransferase [Microbacterium sp. CSI-V]